MGTIGPLGFIGGWNTKASPMSLPPNSLLDAQDVNIVYGDIVKRKGSAKINSSAVSGSPAIHGIFDWQISTGQRSLIVTAGTKILKSNDLASSLTDITGAVTITSGQNNQSTFASLNDILVRCGGATPDAPVKWTGSGNAAALAGSPPSGNIVTVVNNFMFISGISATPSRINWSNVGDPETWGSSNYADFRKSDGDKVTALSEIDQNLVIFKRRSIGILWTLPPSTAVSVTLGPLTQVIPNVGCPGPLCVDKLDDGRLVFLGTNAHVYLFDGSTIEDISDTMPPKSCIQPTLDNVNIGRLQYACVKFYPTRREVWVSLSESGSNTNNAIYVYSLQYGCWESKFTGIAANYLCNSLDTRGTPSHPIIMLTGSYNGFVYEQDNGTTNAEDTNGIIDGFATTNIPLATDSREFIPRSILLPIESGGQTNLEVNYGFNGYTETLLSQLVSQSSGGAGLDSFILDVSTLAQSQTLFKKIPITNKADGFVIQIQFRNRQASQGFTVHPFFISDEVIA